MCEEWKCATTITKIIEPPICDCGKTFTNDYLLSKHLKSAKGAGHIGTFSKKEYTKEPKCVYYDKVKGETITGTFVVCSLMCKNNNICKFHKYNKIIPDEAYVIYFKNKPKCFVTKRYKTLTDWANIIASRNYWNTSAAQTEGFRINYNNWTTN
jgi:hypothetical protein